MDHDGARSNTRETLYAALYFAVYLVYLFFHQESEFEHYLGLVLVPLAGLWWVAGRPGLRRFLASIGLRRSRWRSGLGTALAVGLAVQVLPLMGAPNRARLADALAIPGGWILPIVALPFLLVTVAFTEEVFFRGILQTRFSDTLGSGWAGIAVTTVAFAAYHVPYAYLNPYWPSAGDLSHAIRLSVLNAGIGGVLLGWVFMRWRRNLLAPMLVHAMIDWIPGTILLSEIKFG